MSKYADVSCFIVINAEPLRPSSNQPCFKYGMRIPATESAAAFVLTSNAPISLGVVTMLVVVETTRLLFVTTPLNVLTVAAVHVLFEFTNAANGSEPPPAADQVPSPRQKVVALAAVPLLRFATGRLPVTPVARLTFVAPLELKTVVPSNPKERSAERFPPPVMGPVTVNVLFVKTTAPLNRASSTVPLDRLDA